MELEKMENICASKWSSLCGATPDYDSTKANFDELEGEQEATEIWQGDHLDGSHGKINDRLTALEAKGKFPLRIIVDSVVPDDEIWIEDKAGNCKAKVKVGEANDAPKVGASYDLCEFDMCGLWPCGHKPFMEYCRFHRRKHATAEKQSPPTCGNCKIAWRQDGNEDEVVCYENENPQIMLSREACPHHERRA